MNTRGIFTKHFKYVRLTRDDGHEEVGIRGKRTKGAMQRLGGFLSGLGGLFIILLALWGAADVVQILRGKEGTDKTTVLVPAWDYEFTADCYVCGWTAAEAIKRGCVFDEMDLTWVHPRCLDDELVEEYTVALGPWMFQTYIEDGPKEWVNATQLGMMVEPGRVWLSTYGYHLWHCNYNWRKMFRLKSGIPFLGYTRSDVERHIKHCGTIAHYGDDYDEYTTTATYPGPDIVTVPD